MTREEAILNAVTVMNYLAINQRKAYLSLDINSYAVSIHYFNMDALDSDVVHTAEKLDPLIMAGTEITFIRNEQINQLTFDIKWEFLKQ